MKEIGTIFKEKRETIGISKSEICSDLEINEAQLQNLEDGNANAFKDIFFLKELILKYAKYLNLDEEYILNEFNDFIFNFTSKIPVAEIEERVRELQEEENNQKKIVSPYTKPITKKNRKRIVLIYMVSILLVIVLFLLVVITIKIGLN